MKKIMICCATLLAGLTLTSCNSNSADSPEMQAFVKKIKGNLVFVEGGSFMMGDAGREVTDENGNTFLALWSGHNDARPIHKVTLDSYSLQKYETTFGEYDYYRQLTGQEVFKKDRLRWESRQPKNALTGVTWQEASDYCSWLGETTGLPFDLPTEAQWEYAARSRGQNVGYATDNGQLDADRNFRGRKAPSHVQPPGTYPPNPLGLYEMSGNTWEWVKDWYHWDYYQESPELNPQGPVEGQLKVLRGYGILTSYGLNTLYGRKEEASGRGQGGGRCVVNAPLAVSP